MQIVVFHMRGCGPCHEYLPRFRAVAIRYKGQLAIRAIDLAKSRKDFQDAAIKFKIEGTPTTLLLDDDDKVVQKQVGAITNTEIAKLFRRATALKGKAR